MSDARSPAVQEVQIEVDGQRTVSGLLQAPANPRACLVLAHGAGAGIRHPFMEAVAEGLAQRGLATLRYQFPYMEAGSRRPDGPPLAQATVRAAVAAGAWQVPRLPLFAGGKSFGGRMTSQAQAAAALPDVRGLVFFGFPLHPAKKPSAARAEHLDAVAIPMLFLQGTRDALADMALVTPLATHLSPRATLLAIDNGDHSFHVPVRSGRTDAEVMAAMLDATAAWIDRILG